MQKVYRIFVEKKAAFNVEGQNYLNDIRNLLKIDIKKLRLLYRYDIQGIDDEVYKIARNTIFSDPAQDFVFDESVAVENAFIFAIEYLPGQFDQRSDSAAQCIQIITQKEKPIVKSAKLFIIAGKIDPADKQRIKEYCINPVDSREADLKKSLNLAYDIPEPPMVKILDGFRDSNTKQLHKLVEELGLAMTIDDLAFCQKYFKEDEQRDPTITEIKMLDTYWSDHCRHTTFLTEIENIEIEPGPYSELFAETYQKYQKARHFVYGDTVRADCLMDLATISMKEFKKKGYLKELDDSDEINACTIRVPIDNDGEIEDWLILFKNETHNHPTEIEPFGGAATCLGGAIRDPLSGRAYVYQAMRVTGSADPRASFEDTLPGKLPQRVITTLAAKGYSSYGNQIGLATGLVTEVYHQDYIAKRLEIGAVVGAVAAKNVKREKPKPGDAVLLIGGQTGRDGIGGATGSSKAHTEKALENEAEVQKGNPPIERMLQRFFRNPQVISMIKKCNDFGAGGVSVAIGELADSIDINLDKVTKKYQGLDGTELALSESQERMAVLLDAKDVDAFIKHALSENIEANPVATVTDSGFLRMYWRSKPIVNIKRDFLKTNGLRRKNSVIIKQPEKINFKVWDSSNIIKEWHDVLSDLNICSQKGLVEQFDSTIGAANVLHPFGGKYKATPIETMISKIPYINTDFVTLMSFGFDPYLAKKSPFHGAVNAVIESILKIVAAGGDYKKIYFSFQEYFEKMETDPEKWGKPYAALLGAYYVLEKLQLASIGGKDSMSGTFRDIDVPPTFVSFALATGKASQVISNELKKPGNFLYVLKPELDKNDLPDLDQLKEIFDFVHENVLSGKILSANIVKYGGIAASLSKMAFGNMLGINLDLNKNQFDLFENYPGSVIIETSENLQHNNWIFFLGKTTAEPKIFYNSSSLELKDLHSTWHGTLKSIFPFEHKEDITIESNLYKNNKQIRLNLGKKPVVCIPVFPGTNCEYETEIAFLNAGSETNIHVFKNLNVNLLKQSLEHLADSIYSSNIFMIPGGFSAGDEPEGSGKFIAAVLRNPLVKDALLDLIYNRDGLVLGICNGFQALVKVGLLPYGKIQENDPQDPTLTFNKLKRHHSCYVYTKIISDKSPWFYRCNPGEVFTIPVSNGEGRFVCSVDQYNEFLVSGQISTQYVDLEGNPSLDSDYNPSDSFFAIEGLTSPDGKILGKMAHTERYGKDIAKNIDGKKYQPLFESGVEYFK